MLAVKRAHHGLFFDPRELALCHRGCRSHAKRLACQGSFSEEIAVTQDANRRFLAGLGDDGQLYFALLDIENRVRRVALREDGVLFRNLNRLPALANRRKETCRGRNRGFS